MKAISEVIKALYGIKAALLGENVSGNVGNNETNENGGKFDLIMSNIVAPDYIFVLINGREDLIEIIEPSQTIDLDSLNFSDSFICAYKERPSDNTKWYINEIDLFYIDNYAIDYKCYDSSSPNIDTVENIYIEQGYNIPQELLNCYCYNNNNSEVIGGGMA